MPRSEDRGTIAGRATIAGREAFRQVDVPKRVKASRSGRRRRGRMKQQRKAVHAVAQAGRLRPIVEDVAEMAAAAAAMNFGAQHPEGAVFGLADGVLERLVEARPAGAALKFGLRGEQRQVAAGAGEDALAMLLEQRARSGRSVPSLRRISYCCGVSCARHSASVFSTSNFSAALCRGNPQPAERGQAKQTGDRGEQDTAVNHDGLRARRVRGARCQIRDARMKVTPIGREFSHFLAR